MVLFGRKSAGGWRQTADGRDLALLTWRSFVQCRLARDEAKRSEARHDETRKERRDEEGRGTSAWEGETAEGAEPF